MGIRINRGKIEDLEHLYIFNSNYKIFFRGYVLSSLGDIYMLESHGQIYALETDTGQQTYCLHNITNPNDSEQLLRNRIHYYKYDKELIFEYDLKDTDKNTSFKNNIFNIKKIGKDYAYLNLEQDILDEIEKNFKKHNVTLKQFKQHLYRTDTKTLDDIISEKTKNIVKDIKDKIIKENDEKSI